MRKLSAATALLLSFLFLFTACVTPPDNSPASSSSDVSDPGEQTSSGQITEAPSSKGEENTTEDTSEGNILNGPVPETLKILAIGNSFSTDGMQYLYNIAKSAGVQNVILGNLYIGGCSIQTHYAHSKSGAAAYTYYKNTNGSWVTNKEKSLMHGLTDESWDFISLQQSSPLSGIATSYDNTLAGLIQFVNQNKTNPSAKLIWHMTWAYQSDSTHSAFPNYSRDQMKMYSMIIDAVKNSILTIDDFKAVIPSGTAIQNARTGFVGDKLTRDGYHLNLNLGRYIAGLAWYAAISGAPVANITYNPAPNEITEEVMALAKEAVENAIKNPYSVTESSHKSGVWNPGALSNTNEVNAADCYESDLALAAQQGVNLDNYVILEYEYKTNAYWYNTQGVTIVTPSSSASTYRQNVCTTRMYTKEELLNAVIICDAGWQFRPETWVSNTTKATTRRALTTANFTLMDATWWGSDNYFALNIAASPKADISAYYAAAASHVRIYVPKTN